MCTSTVSFEFKGNLGEWGLGQDRVFQRGVLPGRSCAKARGWGSLCLQSGQRLRPISAGFQGLIRKGGMQKGPPHIPQHLLSTALCLSRCLLEHLRTRPLRASNRMCKGKQKQVLTSQDRLHLVGACQGHTHHTEVQGAGRSPGHPPQSSWYQNGVPQNSIKARTANLLLKPSWVRDQKGFRVHSCMNLSQHLA